MYRFTPSPVCAPPKPSLFVCVASLSADFASTYITITSDSMSATPEF